MVNWHHCFCACSKAAYHAVAHAEEAAHLWSSEIKKE
jgi:hypothetical protein